MRRRSLITMLASLAAIASLGVGATLAFLTDSDGPLVNSFTVDSGYTNEDQGIIIQETMLGGEGAEELEGFYGLYSQKTNYSTNFTGNEYVDLLPGDIVKKDPNAVLKAGSIESYIFITVDGADDLESVNYDNAVDEEFVIDGWSTDWVKVANLDGSELNSTLDGVYQYKADGKETFDPATYDSVNGLVTSDLFSSIVYNEDITSELAAGETLPVIELNAYAVQARNVDLQEALTAIGY